MSFEKPFGAPKEEQPKLVPVSRLNVGDIVLENGIPSEIKTKRRDGTETVLQLASGGFIRVDSESEEIEVPS